LFSGIRAVWTPGHTFDCACLIVSCADGILISGDTVMIGENDGAYTVCPVHHLETQRESVKRLMLHPFGTLQIIHGSPVESSAADEYYHLAK
jgi:glyoxylase-like metal-dependent hydrolase (beta-lactamase superfamily II)